MQTIKMSAQHLCDLLREAYKQGYSNAMEDSNNRDSEWNNGESDFDDWIAEACADESVGDIPINED